ncbi:HEAT repeat domain-containing protein [Adhaeribacter soli]|uniref:HEAT repeat domain-containing protein n=1 Tax=Adhaeribacter soli TaxID=2607655 RepID=A0A5N1IP10_9BACT|nr:HEAT repeat domain-containing protein [Adhaeribacter soli]KAA9331711.1 hypothetical protein F0P94_12930 [Adhaeribacter soli]
MELKFILNDKQTKPKEKTETLSNLLLENLLGTDELVLFATKAKDPVKVTCIEALEYATKSRPGIATLNSLNFVAETLQEKAPRIKWESAKVIGNIAHLFPEKLDKAIGNLLANTEHSGTVVRWSAAYALGEILKLNLKEHTELLPTLEAIAEREEKNSIKKIYQAAIKKVKR